MSIQSGSTSIGEFVKILRQRYFIDHSSDAKTFLTEEYTLISNHDKVSNIILQSTNFLPNLTVYDSDGEELPVMSNQYTKALIEFWIDNAENDDDRELLERLLIQMRDQEIFIIWIKLPPTKTLIKNQVKVINLEYSASKENRKDDEIILKMPSGESHSVFYTIKQPVDYNFGKQDIFTKNEKGKDIKIKSWKKNKQDLFYVNETQDSLSITSKPDTINPIELHYKFQPKFKVISTPLTGVLFLTFASIFLLGLNDCHINGCTAFPISENWFSMLDRKLEISGAIIGASLVLPRLVTNSLIRHSMLFLYFIPIFLSVVLVLM